MVDRRWSDHHPLATIYYPRVNTYRGEEIGVAASPTSADARHPMLTTARPSTSTARTSLRIVTPEKVVNGKRMSRFQNLPRHRDRGLIIDFDTSAAANQRGAESQGRENYQHPHNDLLRPVGKMCTAKWLH